MAEFDHRLQIISLARHGPYLNKGWELSKQSGSRADVRPNGLDEKAGSYKASSPFNGHFVLVWLVIPR